MPWSSDIVCDISISSLEAAILNFSLPISVWSYNVVIVFCNADSRYPETRGLAVGISLLSCVHAESFECLEAAVLDFSLPAFSSLVVYHYNSWIQIYTNVRVFIRCGPIFE